MTKKKARTQMAKQQRTYFGEETKTKKTETAKPKRTYTKRAAPTAKRGRPAGRPAKNNGLVQIWVPAEVAFNIGYQLGQSA